MSIVLYILLQKLLFPNYVYWIGHYIAEEHHAT